MIDVFSFCGGVTEKTGSFFLFVEEFLTKFFFEPKLQNPIFHKSKFTDMPAAPAKTAQPKKVAPKKIVKKTARKAELTLVFSFLIM